MKSSCTSISCRFLWAKFSTMISAANSAKSTFPVKPSSKKHIIFLCWVEECFSIFFKEINPLSAQWGIFRTISKTKTKKSPAISKSRKKVRHCTIQSLFSTHPSSRYAKIQNLHGMCAFLFKKFFVFQLQVAISSRDLFCSARGSLHLKSKSFSANLRRNRYLVRIMPASTLLVPPFYKPWSSAIRKGNPT